MANTKNLGLLLTQYEKYGTCGENELRELILDEEIELDESMIGEYNEYLLENGFEPYEDDLNMMLEGLEPWEIVQKTFYGKFNNPYDDYFQFNGYANIDSFSSYQVVQNMKNDKDFLDYLKENIDLEDYYTEEEQKEIIDNCNKLIKLGY
jgi:hypothetical protein